MKNNEIFNAYNTIQAQKPWRYENSDIFHHRILPFATVAPWLNDVDFLNIYEKVKNNFCFVNLLKAKLSYII